MEIVLVLNIHLWDFCCNPNTKEVSAIEFVAHAALNKNNTAKFLSRNNVPVTHRNYFITSPNENCFLRFFLRNQDIVYGRNVIVYCCEHCKLYFTQLHSIKEEVEIPEIDILKSGTKNPRNGYMPQEVIEIWVIWVDQPFMSDSTVIRTGSAIIAAWSGNGQSLWYRAIWNTSRLALRC